jgi:hypothetical protein
VAYPTSDGATPEGVPEPIGEVPIPAIPVVSERTPSLGEDYYVAKYTATWCAICKNAEAQRMATELKQTAGLEVIPLDVDENKERLLYASQLPTYYVVNRRNSRFLYGPWVGNQQASTILNAIRTQDREQSRYTSGELRRFVLKVYKEFPPTQKGMDNAGLRYQMNPPSNVLAHLSSTGGIPGDHPFTDSQVKGLKLWEGLALHDAVHAGKLTPYRIDNPDHASVLSRMK